MDPIYNTHVKLLASDFLSLTQRYHHRGSSEATFYRNGRPVSKGETVGVVVCRERKENFLRFYVDDGSGCIPCVLWLNHLTSPYFSRRDPSELELMAGMAVDQAEEVRLGSLVRVRGRITTYRGLLQITVSNVIVENDPNTEILHWLDCVRLAQNCYDVAPRSQRKTR